MTNRLKLAVVGGLAGAFALAGCGSSNSSSTGASASDNAQCVSTAQAAVTKATAPLQPPSPGPKIDVSPNAGKTIWLITPFANPFLQAIEGGFKDGAAEAGVTPKVFEGTGTVTSWNQGVASAVAQHADAIVLFAINPDSVQASLKPAIAAHIPVIDAAEGDPDTPQADGIYAQVTADFTADGALAANAILADSKCNANVGIFSIPNQPTVVNQQNGAIAQLKKLCPTCKSYTGDVDGSTAATTVTPLVATTLRAHPDINYLYPTLDGIVPYTNAAVKQVRPSVKVISHDGVDAQLDAVRAGDTPQFADIAFPPGAWIGWTLIDTTQRALLGDKPGNTLIPSMLVTKANAGPNNASLMPAFADPQSIFAPVWGK